MIELLFRCYVTGTSFSVQYQTNAELSIQSSDWIRYGFIFHHLLHCTELLTYCHSR
jgi:hypothetical protein